VLKTKTYYDFGKGLAIYVNYIMEKHKDQNRYNVSWYARDEKTKKFASMDITQEMVIFVDQEKDYKEIK